MVTQQQTYGSFHQNCTALLLAAGNDKEPELIYPVAAAKLLGKIDSVRDGLGGTCVHRIRQQDVRNAGLDIVRWEVASLTGLLRKTKKGTDVTYELPEQVQFEEHTVPTTLIAQLEAISGMTHAQARRIAAKHPEITGGALQR